MRYAAHGATTEEVELSAAEMCNHLFPDDPTAEYVVLDCTATRVHAADGRTLKVTLEAEVVAGPVGELREAGHEPQ